jgi:UDP-2,3-diacylglucosamine hydrolase
MAADMLPAPREWLAPPAWATIDFISDIHLAEDTPQAFDALHAYLLGTPADAVFILGDLFEAWVGDDARHDAFEARCVGLLREASERRWLGFMVGNRDFLVGAEMLAACGMTGLADPLVLAAFGRRVVLSHGDALCIADIEYQRLRTMVRNPQWQAGALARPIAERRQLARAMRTASEKYHAGQAPDVWFDADRATMLTLLEAAQAPDLIHGHTHRPGDETLAPSFTRHVLSDWSLDHGPARRAEVLRWRGEEFVRMSPEAAVASS